MCKGKRNAWDDGPDDLVNNDFNYNENPEAFLWETEYSNHEYPSEGIALEDIAEGRFEDIF